MARAVEPPHGLGPHAVEIADKDMASAFVLVGENVYLSQPVHGHRDTIILSREAGERLARAILDQGAARSLR